MVTFLLLFALVWVFGVWALYRGFLCAPELEDERTVEARAALEQLEQEAAARGEPVDFPVVPSKVRSQWNDPLVTFPRS